MSGTLRDLTVSIDFNNDISELLRVDTALNEIESELRQVGAEIDDTTDEFRAMGGEALIAAALADEALQSVENQAGDTKREVGWLGDGFTIASLKALALAKVWILGSSAAIAASAPLLLAVGGLAASMAAAGIGAMAFGTVAVGALAKVFESSTKVEQIQQKINNASSTKEKIKAQKELAAVYAGMSKEQRGALQELQGFKSFWGGFVKQFDKPIFQMFGTGLKIVENILKGLAPTISNVSFFVNKLMNEFSASINAGALQGFFDWLSTNAAGSLYNFANIAGNVMSGFFSLLEAFAPIGVDMENGLLSLTEKFKTWAASLQGSTAFQDFITYAQTNGPVLIGIVSNLWDIFKKLIADLAPLGTEVLAAIQGVTGAINDNWPAVTTTVLALAGGVGTFVGVMKTLQIIETITTLIAAFRAGTLLATAAELGLNTALLLNPFTWIAVAIAGLIAAGIALYRNWDTVKVKMSAAWEWIKRDAANTINFIISGINAMIGLINKIPGVHVPIIAKVNWGAAPQAGGKPIVGTKSVLPSKGIQAVGGKTLAPNALANAFAGRSHATGLERVPYDGYIGQLHAGEAVLTAQQSNAMRASGILSRSGDKPRLDLSQNVAPTGKMRSATVFAPTVKVEVNGATGDAKEIGKQAAAAAKRELEKLFIKLGLQYA